MRISISFLIALAIASTISCYKSPTSNSAQSAPVSTPSSSTPSADTKSASSGSGYTTAIEAYNAKRFDDAVKGFQSVIASDAKNFDAHYYLGKSFEGLKKSDDAINAYKEAVRFKPDHADANFSAGSLYYSKGNYQAALPFLEQAAKTDFKSPKVLMALGENQRMLKMYDVAIVQFGKVIGFEPDNPNPYYALGLTYLGLNNKIGARQQLRKLETLNKDLAKKLSGQIGS